MTMDIPPYISVSILNKSSFTATRETTPQTSPRTSDASDTSITIVPKKRSFDVAFLISTDDDRRKSPDNSFRSAFRKVGISNFADSRTPSPIDPTRTPSPPEVSRRTPQEMFHPFVFAPRVAMEEKPEKSFPTPGFLNPVPRSFLPNPIFAGNLPTNFVAASLLPPSLAALTLPGQNICAKCNVSFRMTSDLVYHMRSHHKNDSVQHGQLRKRRDLEKLKCPVCNESFRERHHLTRHMTAHQDKAGDNLERPLSSDRCRIKICNNTTEYQQ